MYAGPNGEEEPSGSDIVIEETIKVIENDKVTTDKRNGKSEQIEEMKEFLDFSSFMIVI